MQYVEIFAFFHRYGSTLGTSFSFSANRRHRTTQGVRFPHVYRKNPKIEGVPLKLRSTLQTPPTPQSDKNGPATESRHRPFARSPTHGDLSVA